jgi:GNAT superfamily N-acetyltransferase
MALAARGTCGTLLAVADHDDDIAIAVEPFDAPDGAALRDELAAELVRRYGHDSEPGEKPTATDVALFLVARDGAGRALGCGALRAIEPGVFEIKRMLVRNEARGRGLGRRLLAALEEHAAALGARRLLLEAGPEQPEAIGLYEQAGYRPVPCFGAYAGAENSLCFGRDLDAS